MEMLNQLLYLTVRACFRVFGSLPDSIREGCAGQLGRMVFAMDRKHRRIVVDNLSFALGSEKSSGEIQMLARQVFQNLGRILFEIAWARNLQARQLARHFTFSGLDAYQQAASRGKGVLCLVAHFGNWELLPIAGHLARIPVRIVYRPLDAPFLERFFKESRCRFGAKVIATRKGAMRGILWALRKGFPVAMLMDQNVDWYEGVFVDFFKHRACTNKGMAVLALKSEAPVVPVFLVRTPTGFHAAFGPELPLIQTGDKTRDIESNTQLYNRTIEAYVRRFPDQWFWVHQRWKTRPYKPWPRVDR